MPENYKDFCCRVYNDAYNNTFKKMIKNNTKTSIINNIRRHSQRVAIDKVLIEALLAYPDIPEKEIWAAISTAHKINVAQLNSFNIPAEQHENVINTCLAAQQSWIKASGHSFERFIAGVHSNRLKQNEIEFILQSQLTKMIKNNALVNTKDDIIGLTNWGKDFDLYAIQRVHEEWHVFGCIQSKTSIRDRVGRDVTFSHNAMDGLFWSVAVTLDGEFLNMQEFINMVNGGGSYQSNGWHGMYAMSGINDTNGRIYKVNDTLDLFIDHAICAARQFISDRRMLNSNWKV